MTGSKIQAMFKEVQLDSIVGPTHQFAGLGLGNVASIESKGEISSPKKAALEGLEKMGKVMKKGVPQLFLPPQKRPATRILKELGFESLKQAYEEERETLFACYSSSYMWTANAATSTPSLDATDGRHHLTPANLCSNLHRHLEVKQTEKFLQEMNGEGLFHLHPPLPAVRGFFDEGAANHTRLSPKIDTPGLHLFVYGTETTRFPARQSKRASEAIARSHRLPKERTLFLEQNPQAIDLGVFHNDVISVGHLDLLLVHEKAYKDGIDKISSTFEKLYSQKLNLHVVKESEIPLETALKTYFFNSQILSLPNGELYLLAPKECEENSIVKKYIEKLPYFSEVEYISLRQSMKNGGGPACLRLRLLLNENEQKSIPQKFWLNPRKADLLSAWIDQHYPNSLRLEELRDESFAKDAEEIQRQLLRMIERMD